MRYEFGKNWKDFVAKSFSEERVNVSKQHILDFLEMTSLEGISVMDIGCGSGLSSLAAFRAKAKTILGFDYDRNSVETSQYLRSLAGSPENWAVTQGSVLDRPFLDTLEKVDLVYSWGVLHHTGEQWTAIANAASLVKPGGLLYIALYTSDSFISPTPEFWLDIKQRYNRAGALGRWKLEAWYIWNFSLGRRISALPRLIEQFRTYKKSRGMSYIHDVRDWLGGWPMEFSSIAEVQEFVCGKLGFTLVKQTPPGHANVEYLFRAPHQD